ncbi:hypothetical protein LOTGIDRAFT_175890 [Lottia gigantea]|uniref:Sulfotransferase domain-containing protein n=1 Tax=Lottia gigantea TaxID=225164 RepID=V4BID5_LOTGI|nr:hypothetical protein LOTGIDRAFT_175890 [Lottia gigantea]ESO88379.1 hypothetical protein LOTGIDRAFT_175890 [Lottia gigantea]
MTRTLMVIVVITSLLVIYVMEFKVYHGSNEGRKSNSGPTSFISEQIPTKANGIQQNTSKDNLVANTNISKDQVPGIKCSKRFNIAFLKTHKSGSTTVSNILYRFAIRNRLNLALPNKRGKPNHWVLGDLTNFTDASILRLPTGEHYNILAVESIYRRDVFRRIVPSNPYFLTIVREPVDRFISYVFFNKKNNVEGMPYVIKNSFLKDKVFKMAAKGMSLDFGMKYNGSKLLLDPRRFVQNITTDFDLILVAEYFDESLLLLKRQLCWELKDIIYISKNVNAQKRNYALDAHDVERVRNLTQVDNMLYSKSKTKLLKQIWKLGIEFLDEVFHFKGVLKLVKNYCVHGMKHFSNTTIPESEWNQRFSVTEGDCRYLLMDEPTLVGNLQERTWLRYTKFRDGF